MTVIDSIAYMAFYPGLETNHQVFCGGPIELKAGKKNTISFQIPSNIYSCEYRFVVPKY